ncbi:hypothetical protein GCK72_003990 [Caenorhabditis remanei]|uniref:Transcription initiation factor IIF subunit alpha n=1 Tax=Caenorhabditis remanei TaxID=31234 RepID=A0A6A5HB35_CAERE|nr:hypothetical protein GCK72_003990 [Caenorhabditis remanei]KAF1764044.1 hypothetical protein GCK72_003990 [Caenorhabditis remanei]
MDKVDTSKWTLESAVTMEREDNQRVILSTQTVQEYGEGSEYGKAAREEARRKKYGRQSKSYKLDNQPWKLTFTEPEGRQRQMRGIREGGANEHADYWVFLKPPGSSEFKEIHEEIEIQAYKVDEWHKFLPAITHKTLDIDQAEEQFSQRNKVMNQFALKAAIQNQLNATDDSEMTEQQKRLLKIKDEGSSDDSDDGDDDGEGGDEKKAKNKKKKKKKNLKPAKEKRQRVENSDEVATPKMLRLVSRQASAMLRPSSFLTAAGGGLSDDVRQRIAGIVKKDDVVVFMKGTQQEPAAEMSNCILTENCSLGHLVRQIYRQRDEWNTWIHTFSSFQANKEHLKAMLKLAKNYKKALEDEKNMTDQELAIKNVGKMDPKRHIADEVSKMLNDNIVQSLAGMMATTSLQ